MEETTLNEGAGIAQSVWWL